MAAGGVIRGIQSLFSDIESETFVAAVAKGYYVFAIASLITLSRTETLLIIDPQTCDNRQWDGSCPSTKGTIKIRTTKGPDKLDEHLSNEKSLRDWHTLTQNCC